MFALSLALYGEPKILPDFPQDKSIRGIGASDWPTFAEQLSIKFSYQNTFYDAEPRLDLRSPPPEMTGTCDFVICSEVLEHVLPPVQPAFDGIHRILKPGGTLVMTVPYQVDMPTIEHFPDLKEFTVTELGGTPVLVNRTAVGAYQVFDNLVFHGGRGSTLEMRIFGDQDLLAYLERAGFEKIDVIRDAYEQFGIVFHCPWSLPIMARKAPVGERIS